MRLGDVKRRGWGRGLVAVAPILGVLGAPGAARADYEACAKAYGDAQHLRAEAKLLEARKELLVCAQECSAAFKKDCAGWLEEVDAELPAVALRVVAPDGCDRPSAAIAIDGVEDRGLADGRPIEVDPGPHEVTASVDGLRASQPFVVAAGERRRVVTVVFPGGAGITCGAPRAVGPAPRPVEPRRPVPPLAYALGGLGLVSAGVATGFGVSAFGQKSTLDGCKGSCAAADVDAMQRTFLVADVAVVVAAASLVAAGVLYLTR